MLAFMYLTGEVTMGRDWYVQGRRLYLQEEVNTPRG
jgi:hypothetical protein